MQNNAYYQQEVEVPPLDTRFQWNAWLAGRSLQGTAVPCKGPHCLHFVHCLIVIIIKTSVITFKVFFEVEQKSKIDLTSLSVAQGFFLRLFWAKNSFCLLHNI